MMIRRHIRNENVTTHSHSEKEKKSEKPKIKQDKKPENKR